jgi:lysozyme family protein
MADFSQAIGRVLKNEGGYSNVLGDNGGETYRGITRKNFPNWSGWTAVDFTKRTTGLVDEQIIHNSDLEKEVEDFYKKNFWDENRLGEVKDQDIAGKLLDMAVNMGSSRAGKILQQVLANDCRLAINIDGKIGKETLGALNSQSPSFVLGKIKDRCKAFYESLVEARPQNKQFLKGWLRRAGE